MYSPVALHLHPLDLVVFEHDVLCSLAADGEQPLLEASRPTLHASGRGVKPRPLSPCGLLDDGPTRRARDRRARDVLFPPSEF